MVYNIWDTMIYSYSEFENTEETIGIRYVAQDLLKETNTSMIYDCNFKFHINARHEECEGSPLTQMLIRHFSRVSCVSFLVEKWFKK